MEAWRARACVCKQSHMLSVFEREETDKAPPLTTRRCSKVFIRGLPRQQGKRRHALSGPPTQCGAYDGEVIPVVPNARD